MTTSGVRRLTYWDASAAIEALIPERGEVAAAHAESGGANLLSSLGWAEVHGVIARMRRQGAITNEAADKARAQLDSTRWLWSDVVPFQTAIEELAGKWRLRGADLWHLAAAKTLREERPELKLFTFDERLRAAAEAEGLA